MLLVLLPVPFIGGTIEVHVLTLTLRFVVDPVTFINIAISMDQPAESVGHVIEPVTIVPTAIQPDLDASAFSHVGHRIPFSLVLGPVLKCGKLHEFSHEFLGISVVVLKRIQILQNLVDDGILKLFTLLRRVAVWSDVVTDGASALRAHILLQPLLGYVSPHHLLHLDELGLSLCLFDVLDRRVWLTPIRRCDFIV